MKKIITIGLALLLLAAAICSHLQFTKNMTEAVSLSEAINGSTPPTEEYWEQCLELLFRKNHLYDRADIMQAMEWGSTGSIITLNPIHKYSVHSDHWFYYNGVLTLQNPGVWEIPILMQNIKQTSDSEFTLDNPLKDGYILMYRVGEGVYILRITVFSPSSPVTDGWITPTEFVDGPWVDHMLSSEESIRLKLYAKAIKIHSDAYMDEGEGPQEYWGPTMDFIMDSIPQEYWSELFSQYIFRTNGFKMVSLNNFKMPSRTYVEWSKNIIWTEDHSDMEDGISAKLLDPSQSGWFIFFGPAAGKPYSQRPVYLVEITNEG